MPYFHIEIADQEQVNVVRIEQARSDEFTAFLQLPVLVVQRKLFELFFGQRVGHSGLKHKLDQHYDDANQEHKDRNSIDTVHHAQVEIRFI